MRVAFTDVRLTIGLAGAWRVGYAEVERTYRILTRAREARMSKPDRYIHLNRDEAQYLSLLVVRQDSVRHDLTTDAVEATNEIQRLEAGLDSRALAERLMHVAGPL